MPSSKRQLKDILGLTRSTFTYEKISADIDGILSSGENNRQQKLQEYYFKLFDSVYTSGINYRLSEEVKPTFWGFFTDFNKIDGKTIRNNLGSALKQMITEKNAELGKSLDQYFGATLEQRKDMVLNTGKKLTQMQALIKTGSEQKISRLNEVSSGILKSMAARKGEKYTPNVNTNFNKNIEELYILYATRKDTFRSYLEGRTKFWRFLHSREISKTEKFFKDSESVFAQAGFDSNKHLYDVTKRLESTPCEFVGFQIDMAKDEYNQKKEELENAEKLKEVNQLTAAGDKLKSALELDKAKETSFEAKIQPYIEKYNIEVGAYGLPMYHIGHEGAAEAFDTLRDLNAVRSDINQRFISILGFVAGGYLRTNNGAVNPAEILKVSQEILEIDLKHYTVVYDHPEAKSIADNNIYGNIETSVIQRKIVQSVKSYNRKNNIPFTEESEKELRETIDSVVKENREAQRKAVEERDKKVESVVDNDNNANRQPLLIEMQGDIHSAEFVPKIEETEKTLSNKELNV